MTSSPQDYPSRGMRSAVSGLEPEDRNVRERAGCRGIGVLAFTYWVAEAFAIASVSVRSTRLLHAPEGNIEL